MCRFAITGVGLTLIVAVAVCATSASIVSFPDSILDGRALLRVDNAIDKREVDVTVTSGTEKRDAHSGLPESVGVVYDVEGERVEKRYTRSAEYDDLDMYDVVGDSVTLAKGEDVDKRDWAVYKDDASDSVMMVTRDADGSMSTEGPLHHKGMTYFVQPVEGSRRHAIHRLSVKRDIMSTEKVKATTKRAITYFDIELSIAFGPQMVKRWRSEFGDNKYLSILEKYYAFLVSQLNGMFEAISTPDSWIVRVVPVGFYVIKDESDRAFDIEFTSQDRVNDKGLLASIAEWAVKKGIKGDVVQFFSGEIFQDNSFKGIATTGGICTTGKSNIVLDRRSTSTLIISAHELGHTMGMSHDDVKTCDSVNTKGVPYIMRPINTGLLNNGYPSSLWKFSPCSAQNLVDTLNKLTDKHCLAPSTEKPKTEDTYLGLGINMSWNEQCNFIETGTVLDVSVQAKHPIARICHTMCCGMRYSTTCTYSVPHDGTQCGDMKICQSGECNEHEKGKPMDENCPFGRIDIQSDCQAKDPGQIPTTFRSKTWAQSCEAKGRGYQLCKNIQDNFVKQLSDICIEMYCGLAGADSCTGYTPLDGIPCGNRKVCYDGACVQSQEYGQQIDETCPFGDIDSRLSGSTCKKMARSNCLVAYFAKACCVSCRETPAIEDQGKKKTTYRKFTLKDGKLPTDLLSIFQTTKAKDPGPNPTTFRSKTWAQACEAQKAGYQLCKGIQYRKKLSDICTAIYCGTPGATSCYNYKPFDGIPCGNRKICSNGACVQNQEYGQQIDENCPFGDIDILLSTMTCNKMATTASTRDNCKKSSIAKICCVSCGAIAATAK